MAEMPTLSPQWDSHALWVQLEPMLPGLSVEVLERTASTNTAIVERLRLRVSNESVGTPAAVRRSVESGAFGRRISDVQPCLLVAEQQTGGRGRQGRVWRSATGASLTFSLAMPLRPADWSGLSLAVGVALADALEPIPDAAARHARPRIGLKWPNDLWLMDDAASGRKLGGILIETVSAGAHRLAVVGIGLNVRPMPIEGASQGYACLQELQADTDPAKVLHQVALPVVSAVRQFERSGFSAFAARFDARDLLRDHAVQTTQADAAEGVAQGVSPQGALLVRTDSGLIPVASGEVSVRLSPHTGAAAPQQTC